MDGKGMDYKLEDSSAVEATNPWVLDASGRPYCLRKPRNMAGPGLTRGVGSDFCVEGSWVSQYCLDKMTGDGGKLWFCYYILFVPEKWRDYGAIICCYGYWSWKTGRVLADFYCYGDLLHKPDIPWAWILWTYMLVFSWIKESYQWRQQKDLEILERLKWMAKYHSFPWFPWFPYGPMVPRLLSSKSLPSMAVTHYATENRRAFQLETSVFGIKVQHPTKPRFNKR